MNFPVLSTITFLPIVGAFIILLFIRRDAAVRVAALLFTLAAFVLSLWVYISFNQADPNLQFVERARWVPDLDVQYFLGVDGLNLPLLVLNTLLGVVAVLVSWGISLRVREYFFWLLMLSAAVSGVFTALDLIHFFLFWELELLPMFLLINIWGSGRREYSAMKFVIYTLVGSAFMLAGFLILYFTVEPHTFDIMRLANSTLRPTIVPLSIIFWFIFIAYAIKLPMFPFHTWLPDAHTDAPTAVSVILAGVLLKMGGYAMIRINVAIFPNIMRDFALVLAVLATIGVVYGAIVTMAQVDLKKLIAYSSVSHMGYVLLGITALTPLGLAGATMQMVAHGLITGLLFAMVGLTYEHSHTRHIPSLGGLSARMPITGTVFSIAGLASLGLPTMCGFIAEFLVFVGSFPVWGPLAVISIFGIVLTAGYILWMIQRVFHGPLKPEFDHVVDASPLERVPMFILVVFIMLLGLAPSLVTNNISLGLRYIVAKLV